MDSPSRMHNRAYSSIIKHKVVQEFVNRMIFKYRIALKSKAIQESQADLTTLLIRELGKMSIFKKSAKYAPVKKIRKNNINSAFSTSNKRIDTEYEEANFKDENVTINDNF